MARDPLHDGHGRRIGDLRVSVTDRCNFRCQYCMPAEGLPWLERDRRAHASRRSSASSRCWPRWASRDVRLTGGEPLVRRDFPRARRAARPPSTARRAQRHDQRLPARARRRGARRAPAIDRFNVSIDSLQRDRFFEMTRRDALPRVLRGPRDLAAFPEAHPIKVNAVAMRGFTEDEVAALRARSPASTPTRCASSSSCRWTPTTPGRPSSVLTGDEIRARHPRRVPARARAARAARHRARLPLRRRPGARSASSTRSPSRSAATATASA